MGFDSFMPKNLSNTSSCTASEKRQQRMGEGEFADCNPPPKEARLRSYRTRGGKNE